VNYTTLAYRAATGQALWASRYRGPRNFSFAKALGVSPTGQGVFRHRLHRVHDGCSNFGTVATSPSDLAPGPVAAGIDAYNDVVPATVTPRSHAQVTALFGGLPLCCPAWCLSPRSPS